MLVIKIYFSLIHFTSILRPDFSSLYFGFLHKKSGINILILENFLSQDIILFFVGKEQRFFCLHDSGNIRLFCPL